MHTYIYIHSHSHTQFHRGDITRLTSFYRQHNILTEILLRICITHATISPKLTFSELLSIPNATPSHQNAPAMSHGYAYTAFLINYYHCIATNNLPNRCHRHCNKPYTPLRLCTLPTPAVILPTLTITKLLPNICITNATISPKPHYYTHRLTGGGPFY